RRRHTRFSRDWSSDVCSSDLSFVSCLPKSTSRISVVEFSPNLESNALFRDVAAALHSNDGSDQLVAINDGVTPSLTSVRINSKEIGRASCRERVNIYEVYGCC